MTPRPLDPPSSKLSAMPPPEEDSDSTSDTEWPSMPVVQAASALGVRSDVLPRTEEGELFSVREFRRRAGDRCQYSPKAGDDELLQSAGQLDVSGLRDQTRMMLPVGGTTGGASTLVPLGPTAASLTAAAGPSTADGCGAAGTTEAPFLGGMSRVEAEERALLLPLPPSHTHTASIPHPRCLHLTLTLPPSHTHTASIPHPRWLHPTHVDCITSAPSPPTASAHPNPLPGTPLAKCTACGRRCFDPPARRGLQKLRAATPSGASAGLESETRISWNRA